MKPFAADDFERERRLDKKALETDTIKGLFDRLGFSGFTIAPGERPDATVCLSRGGSVVRVGCELQRLYSDGRDDGSELQRFRGRWRHITEEALASLRSNEAVTPYCVVDFILPSYACLDGLSDRQVVAELVAAGQVLRATKSLEFPRPEMPALSSRVMRIRVLAEDGEGMLWWPSHLRSGPVPEMDEAIVQAVDRKCSTAAQYDWFGASERWLLLVAEAHGLSDLIGGARELAAPLATASCPFTLILVWDRFSEDIWAVHPEFAVICDGAQQRRHLTALPEPVRPFAVAGETYPTRPKTR
jgi:hypothetical protein